ncbi:hypothetical protein EMIHUDRAFT_464769 [Emiliania huxleyi CCMP1516]|uniref:Exportin-1 C-terminal domain-containing protein n=2 Tax=Emiliania huxleyi TaxID=2903 RepID=A0A0D3INM7_EMIH1|nr:hypothetical protein EMIHUDRAFT_464769 [Emiliania huxleyi CCMP1516]EOD12862.1 hypothetical protein EMIHUDRAFT_464769 [Emiliania huxleyi CCMP1516]|eukprot:XP_005765291.1 hypothetical protein EMIHUDRAFT_464769 [Emiliania huxleyi CCMP1516]
MEEQLLNFAVPLDLNVLEQVVQMVYTGTPQQMQSAQRTLSQLQERIAGEDAAGALNWFRVDQILDASAPCTANTRFYALQILDGAIKYRWKTLPPPQQARGGRNGIKNFIVNLVIQKSSDEATFRAERVFMTKLNVILVQIVKQEWPHNWPSFIQDIVNASKTNETLCENNMVVLKLLSEEVFDFSRDEMTSVKAKKLKESFNADFSLIFQLCEYIMANSAKPSLLVCTFQTLLKFLNWIPLGYIFETQLVKTLVYKFLPNAAFRNDVLACLTEVGSLDIGTIYESLTGEIGAAYDSHFEALFTQVATAILRGDGQGPPMVNADLDMAQVWASGTDHDQTFIQNLALFFSCFFRQHLQIAERTAQADPTLLQAAPRPANDSPPRDAPRERELSGAAALSLIVSISHVDDQETFKICLEYWNGLTSDLYHTECQFQPPPQSPLVLAPAALSPAASPRLQLYAPILTKLRQLMVSRMAKPEEVLIVEDENGEIVRETMKDSDAITLYKTMRETLVYLTHLNYDDTENIMLDKLQYQVDGSQWSWHNLNTLCWAIGSISGAMSEEDEKRFLVTVIKDLLGLCEMKRGKDNKAVVASNIMYVVGQYPRFLRAHWKFLKTVVNKLFEFMHELHPGVQDMACDTFLKISQKCRRKFVILQVGEAMPFIDELTLNLRSVISDLEPGQVHVFYEAVGYMVAAQSDAPTRDALLMKLMEWPNQMWVPRVFEAVFKSTLDMITKNFEDFPEHRSNLFNLLRAINHHCFPALLQGADNFTLIIESIKWAFKHTERTVAETGLHTLLELLQNVQASTVMNAFYVQYYLGLLQDVFAAHLFVAVESGAITSPLWPQDGSVAATSNGQYVRELLLQMFTTSFPNLTAAQLQSTIAGGHLNLGLRPPSWDQSAFKQHLRDFLVQVKEFGDSTDLFAEERQQELETKAKEVRTRQEQIPGLRNPHQRNDDMTMD